MPELSIVDAVRIPQDVIFRELNGEGVILDLESGTYFGLDAVDARIWQLCMEHGSLQAVWKSCSANSTRRGETLRSDLLAFVNELSTKRLLAPQS